MISDTFDSLQQRGYVYQLTDETEIPKQLNSAPVTFYIGFDPTADSLHVGHLLPIMAARLLQRHGHRPIMLVGGGTAMVGDPSGKSEMRKMLTKETIADNAEALRQQVARFVSFEGESAAVLVNNADWLLELNYVDFLRDYGKFFSVNRMLTAESVKQRLESGLSFLEFNYMLLQAYDFMVLARDRDCVFQFGGQDQWGNIVHGIDLVRRCLSKSSFGATFPLLTDPSGNKFGKSEGNAVWLDARRTSVFDYYQFWRNQPDSEVKKLLGLFTNLPYNEISACPEEGDSRINRAKEILAYEATALAHGADAAKKAFLSAGSQFGFADPEGKYPTASAVSAIRPEDALKDLPTHEVSAAEVEEGIWIVKLFADTGLAQSNGQARKLIKGGGAYLNDERIAADSMQVTATDFTDGAAMLRSGKKNVRRIVITS
jgi:tyrosyl-tRNA synthetase